MPEIATPHSNRIAFVIGTLFFLAGIIGALGSWGAYWTDTRIQTSGERAEGHVTRKNFLSASDGDSDYVVEYWFQLPGGQRVEAHRGVDKAIWESLREGETLVVHYSAQSPNRNFPTGGGVTSVGVTAFISAIGAVFAVFGGLLILGAVRGAGAKA